MKRIAGLVVLAIGLVAARPSHADEPTNPGIDPLLNRSKYPDEVEAEDPRRFRIDRMIAELLKEDFDRSVDQLLMASDMQFQDPGFLDGSAGAPTIDLELMLSNRRAIKILNHIQGLPERDKARTCEALFARAFQIHTNLFSTWVAIQSDPKIKTKSSVESSRLTVLLAMFATADRGDRALLGKQFEQLDRFAEEANRTIAAQPPQTKADLSRYIPFFFPQQNRSQLNLLQLAADRETNRRLSEQVEHELQQANMAKSEVPIVPWDARTTYFEAGPIVGNMQPDKHMTIYKFYDWTGNAKMDSEAPAQAALVKKLRGIVLP